MQGVPGEDNVGDDNRRDHVAGGAGWGRRGAGQIRDDAMMPGLFVR